MIYEKINIKRIQIFAIVKSTSDEPVYQKQTLFFLTKKAVSNDVIEINYIRTNRL